MGKVASKVGLLNSTEDSINPATEDSLAKLIGFQIPAYDSQVIDEADPNNVTITYSLNSNTVATKLIAVSGTTTTITITFP